MPLCRRLAPGRLQRAFAARITIGFRQPPAASAGCQSSRLRVPAYAIDPASWRVAASILTENSRRLPPSRWLWCTHGRGDIAAPFSGRGRAPGRWRSATCRTGRCSKRAVERAGVRSAKWRSIVGRERRDAAQVHSPPRPQRRRRRILGRQFFAGGDGPSDLQAPAVRGASASAHPRCPTALSSFLPTSSRRAAGAGVVVHPAASCARRMAALTKCPAFCAT